MWRGARLWGLAAILSVAGCDLPDGDMDPMNNDDVSRPEGAATRGGESSAARMPEGEHDMARARIESKSGSSVSGEATLMEQDDALQIVVRLENAPPGSHAVHIHEVGDCSAPDAGSAGGHWNPTGAEHGQRGGESYHAGDLGNVDVGSDGTGVITIDAEDISLEPEGEPSAMGKAIVVHSGPDDFATQPDGAAGERIGCGVIESEQTTSNPSRNP